MSEKIFILSENNTLIKDKINRATDNALKIIERDMKKYASGDIYPQNYKEGRYSAVKNGDPKGGCWMEGFWTGQLWLAYELSGEKKYRELAEKNVQDFTVRLEENNNIDWHHDLGFLYSLSCVAAYKITGDLKARETALEAAYLLSRRFRKNGEFIQSMGFELEADRYKFIIDTMLNVPLLMWAFEESGKDVFRQRAVRHADTTRKNIIRNDGSTYHHFLMNYETGEPVKGITWQGKGDNSCWSRGQAWMVYGAAIMYSYTKDKIWAEVFEKVADYFINNLKEDYIPSWDFAAEKADEDTDSSAAAVVVCGILEMAGYDVLNEKMSHYIDIATKILTSLTEKYAISFDSGKEGLLRGVTHAKPQGNIAGTAPYGDYYYLEALVRAQRMWNKYW